MDRIQIIVASESKDYEIAKALFLEYTNESGLDLYFQNFDDELINIEEVYNKSDGGIFLLIVEKEIAGCIALRRFGKNTGEVKRLYLKQAYRSKGYSKMLVEKIINMAKQIGYHTLRLDTLDTMKAAIKLYTAFGFKRIEKYRPNPYTNACFFELRLEC